MELMKSKVNKKAAEDKKAAEEAVQKRLDDMKNKAANDDGGVKAVDSLVIKAPEDSKDPKDSNSLKDLKDPSVSKDFKDSKPLEIVEPKSGSEVVAPKKKKKKVSKAVVEKVKEEVAEVPKVDVVQDPPKENIEIKTSIVDKVISEMAAGDNQPKNRLAVVERDPPIGELESEGKREWSPTPAPRTRRQRSPLTPLRRMAKANGERPPIPDGPSPPPPKDEDESLSFFNKEVNNGNKNANTNGTVEVRNGGAGLKWPQGSVCEVRFAMRVKRLLVHGVYVYQIKNRVTFSGLEGSSRT